MKVKEDREEINFFDINIYSSYDHKSLFYKTLSELLFENTVKYLAHGYPFTSTIVQEEIFGLYLLND